MERFNVMIVMRGKREPMAIRIGDVCLLAFIDGAAYQEGKSPPRYPMPAVIEQTNK